MVAVYRGMLRRVSDDGNDYFGMPVTLPCLSMNGLACCRRFARAAHSRDDYATWPSPASTGGGKAACFIVKKLDRRDGEPENKPTIVGSPKKCSSAL